MANTPLASFAALLALAAGGLSAQKPVVPPVDPQLPGKLKELKSLVKDRKMTLDFQAIGLMQSLVKNLDKTNPKDKKKMVKAFGAVFKTGKLREGNKDVLYRETSDALEKFGPDGAKELLKAAEAKRFDDNLRLRAHLTLALGKTEDVKQIKYLIEVTTRSPHDQLRAASGEALGYFRKAKDKQKRDIVKEIIRAWGSLHSRATQAERIDPNGPQDFGPQNARRILRACEGKWRSTLGKLTGVTQSKFADWQRWLNKNKNWKPPQ